MDTSDPATLEAAHAKRNLLRGPEFEAIVEAVATEGELFDDLETVAA